MTFDEYYNGDIKNMQDAVKELNKKPFLFFLNEIIMPEKTLTQKDCEKFWKFFREAQKDAFEAGKVF